MLKNFKSKQTKFLLKIILIFILFLAGSVLSVRARTRIMCLGDSITGSPGCWRALLWQNLDNNGYTNIDFIGTQYPQGCGFIYDGEHEGHGGALATNTADSNKLVNWLTASNPDIVLMHFGTNDCWSNRATDTIIAAFTTMVNQMRNNNPHMQILVARIIPMDPSRSCANCGQNVINLNNAIPGWASSMSTAQSPISVVDQWTGFSVINDTYDGVHPNDSGDRKIADKWYPALAALLSGSTVTNPPPASPPGIIPGDVNTSGAVDIVDALMVARYYLGLTPSGFNPAAADVNRDASINIVDALMIAQCYVGLISCNF